MSLFQLGLLVIAGVIFYIFFKKLYSGNYPKRGIDYESKLSNDNIGGLSNPQKMLSKQKPKMTRLEELIFIADESMAKKDYEEAMKALRSAYIIDSKNIDVLMELGYVSMLIEKKDDAKMYYEKVLSLDESNIDARDMLNKISQKET